MPDRPDEFEEAWARIVEDLTSDASGTGSEGAPAGPGGAEPRAEEPAGGSDRDRDAGGSEAGLAALFEPLRRARPQPEPTPERDPGAFVDNWEDEGHFTPPPPPELPEGTPLKRLAWAALLGGPITLALIALTGWDAPRIVSFAAGLATMGGFATLVWLLPDSRPNGGWDDGAQL
jgi:hypothetical protein